MTPEQISLIQTSWASVVPIKEQAAALFYGRLFELDPALKPLFKGDIVEQGKKLMQMLNTVVNGLTQLDQIVPVAKALGKRHVEYGVKPEYYDTVASALLWTLEKGLGSAFTPPVKEAWTLAYATLASVMKDAAYPKAA